MNLPTPKLAGYCPRPGTKNSETHCLYCKRPLGACAADCVCVVRTVVCEITIKFIAVEPRSNTPDGIEFHHGGSSYCLDNDVEQIAEEIEAEGHCACFRSEVKFLREATAQDHLDLGWIPPKEIILKNDGTVELKPE